MRQESHLYPGFRHAGSLASVAIQREIQGSLLSSLDVSRILIVGSGFGEEANILVKYLGDAVMKLHLSVVDLTDVYRQLCAQPFLRHLISKLRFYHIDLLESQKIDGFGKFDIVQCGFVLHDFQPFYKNHAIDVLASSVRVGGYVLISDIFLSAENSVSDILEIYQGFITEAEDALKDGNLNPDAFAELVGDGKCMGLKRSKREALYRIRDFFETRDSMIGRAKLTGLKLVEICHNPICSYMSMLLFKRIGLRDEAVIFDECNDVV